MKWYDYNSSPDGKQIHLEKDLGKRKEMRFILFRIPISNLFNIFKRRKKDEDAKDKDNNFPDNNAYAG